MDALSADVIAAAVDGDDVAAEVLVRRVGRIALPVALATLRDREAASEVAQDVAVDVLRGLAKLRDASAFDSWVRRIAVRQALRAARRRRRRQVVELPLDGVLSTHDEPAARATERDRAIASAEALAELPPKQRVALVLCYVHGLSNAEIAAALDCRTGTAASLLSRGRATLRRHALYTEFAAGGC